MSNDENKIVDTKAMQPEMIKVASQRVGLGFAIGTFSFMVFGSVFLDVRIIKCR